MLIVRVEILSIINTQLPTSSRAIPDARTPGVERGLCLDGAGAPHLIREGLRFLGGRQGLRLAHVLGNRTEEHVPPLFQ